MNLPLSREELDKLKEAGYDGGDATKLIAQARLAIELKEALEWVQTENMEIVQTACGWRIQHWITKNMWGYGDTILEAIQNARRKEGKV